MKRIKNFIERIGTLNIILIIVGAFFLWFNWQMIELFKSYGSMPETYAMCVVGATIGECGICGWIRTNKDKRQERDWEDAKQSKQEREDIGDE